MATIKIEVAYALPDKQKIFTFTVPEGTTIENTIYQSGVLTEFPEIDLGNQKVGIFSKRCALTDIVKAGDRIEIYRPLKLDPKEKRRLRVQPKNKA
jgi:putative ubiquitin-RnfH superfamily antitoxin RatB of RatAB toxin-antitoxin module